MNGRASGRIRVGEIPPLAESFNDRAETAGGFIDALAPGTALVLAPGPAALRGAHSRPGTCGTTQLAVRTAESLWQSGSVDFLAWIPAASRASVLSGVREAFAAAAGTEPAGTAESIAARFAAWLAGATRPWLVILDDLSDPADLEGVSLAGPAGRVLITASQPAAASGPQPGRAVPVGFFSAREALGYLRERTSGDPDRRRGAVDMIDALGGEPLALAQACSVIVNSAMTCMDYREMFLGLREQIETAQGGAALAASVTWLLSLDLADRLLPSPDTRLLLVMIALLDSCAIPGSVFTTQAVTAHLAHSPPGSAEAGPRDVWDVLLTLERVGLIRILHDRREQAPAVSMSRAVQEAVRRTAPADMRGFAARIDADALLEAWSPNEPQTLPVTALRACAASLQNAAADLLWADGCHPLLVRAGHSLDEDHLTGPAVDHWRELVSVSERKLGAGHPGTMALAAQLATAYLAAGQAKEAVTCYQQILAAHQRNLADRGFTPTQDQPRINAARHGLGRALVKAGEPADAITVLAAAASESERALGAAHPDTLDVGDDLAGAYQEAGQPAEAIALLKRTLADRERVQGSRAPATMTTREKLAAAFLTAGQAKDGLGQSRRLLADRERTLGPVHPDTITSRGVLAVACHAAGRMSSALQHSERALADSVQVLGADHRDTLMRCLELAQIYYAAGRVGHAADLLRETAAHCGRVLRPGDLLTAAVEQSLEGLPPGQ